jgi:hypothetical protein
MFFRYATAIGTCLLVFVHHFPIAIAVPNSNYEGVYRLTKVLDANMEEVPVPNGDFTVRMQPGAQANQYNVNIKLGNLMGASATVSDLTTSDGTVDNVQKDAIAISGVRSTMMMPFKELYKVEMALSTILPAAKLIHLETEDTLLVIEGPKGTIQCTRST